MSHRWILIEDALRDKSGHWVEYVDTIRDGLLKLGDAVEIHCPVDAQDWVVEKFSAKPVLPPSIWHRMSVRTNAITRLTRVFTHAWSTYFSVRKHLRIEPSSTPEIIFVPTVLNHHLLAWVFLIKGLLSRTNARVLLFFQNIPVNWSPDDGALSLEPGIGPRLFRSLIRRLGPEVAAGRVILGTETKAMTSALQSIVGVPFRHFPQPVVPQFERGIPPSELVLGSYGPARHEKGSDLLQIAIAQFLSEHPEARVRFVIQWISDFDDENGNRISKLPQLLADSRVTFITNYFGEGEYVRQLRETSIALLPYRLSSYKLRGSRVAIESMIHGIPVVVTAGSTFETQAREYGAAVTCVDGDSGSILSAIETAIDNFKTLSDTALERAPFAIERFSVSEFRRRLTEDSHR